MAKRIKVRVKRKSPDKSEALAKLLIIQAFIDLVKKAIELIEKLLD